MSANRSFSVYEYGVCFVMLRGSEDGDEDVY